MIEVLHVFATIVIGLYAGSLLTEAMILVPFWRKMEPEDFFALHHKMGPNLFKYFAPLTTIAVGAAIMSAIFGDKWNIVAGSLCGLAFVIFFAYFKKANASFASQSLRRDELGPELARWASWHWVRTVFVTLAFAASAVS